jgi:hypothetical protein
MESDKENLQYPPPPDYFKEFTTADKYSPPKLSSLERMDKFISFGSEYSTKKLNISLNPVNVKSVGKKLLKVSKSRNIEKFETLEKKSDLDIDIDSLNLNLIDELEKEILFLMSRYKQMLTDITKNINRAKDKTSLIGLTIQKINFYLIALRRKAVLKKTIDFYNNEIKNCEKTTETAENNIKNFRKLLEDEIKEFTEESI